MNNAFKVLMIVALCVLLYLLVFIAHEVNTYEVNNICATITPAVVCILPTLVPCDLPTATATIPCFQPTETVTVTITRQNTSTPHVPDTVTPTEEPESTPTNTREPKPSDTPIPECYQWLCHKSGTAAEQDYCCDSQGCVDGHMKSHDTDCLGKCK